MTTRERGLAGEAMAAVYLKDRQYEILGAGYRSRYGEIDLIAQKGEITAFVEVKLRKSGNFAGAWEAVTPAKQERIKTTALQWLSENGGERQVRFDIIEIYTQRGEINHIEDAFR